MTLQEAHVRLGEMLMASPSKSDAILTIVLSDPSIGAIAQVRVKDIGLGFDWENNRVLIWPAESIGRITEPTKRSAAALLAADPTKGNK